LGSPDGGIYLEARSPDPKRNGRRSVSRCCLGRRQGGETPALAAHPDFPDDLQVSIDDPRTSNNVQSGNPELEASDKDSKTFESREGSFVRRREEYLNLVPAKSVDGADGSKSLLSSVSIIPQRRHSIASRYNTACTSATMKFTTLSVAAAVLLAGSTEAVFQKPPKPVKPNLVDGFLWRDPFKSAAIEAFDSSCEATRKFDTFEYTLHDLMAEEPKGLKAWSKGLKKIFSEREYPGGWSGYDRHGYDRAILRMAYTDVPLAVREWIEEQERTSGEGKGLYAVFSLPKDAEEEVEDVVGVPQADQVDRSEDKLKTVIFAPGALYHILPLWVAEGSNCQGTSHLPTDIASVPILLT
jgi:hypothetical protein